MVTLNRSIFILSLPMVLYVFTHCVVHGVPLHRDLNNNDVECPDIMNGSITFIPSPTNCSEYYVCVNRIAYLFSCPERNPVGLLYFDPTINVCNWPWLVDCQVTTPSPTTERDTTTIGNTTKTPAETTPHAITTIGTTKTPDEITTHTTTLKSTIPSDNTTVQPEDTTTTVNITSTKALPTTTESKPDESSTTMQPVPSTSEKLLTTKAASTPSENPTTVAV